MFRYDWHEEEGVFVLGINSVRYLTEIDNPLEAVDKSIEK